MKKTLWLLTAAGLTYCGLYLPPLGRGDVAYVWLPLLFIPVYLAGLALYLCFQQRRLPRLHTIYIYVLEAVVIAILSLVAGKLFELREAAAWTAALLTVLAPSATTVHSLIRRATDADEE